MHTNVHCNCVHNSQKLETNVHQQVNEWTIHMFIQWDTTQNKKKLTVDIYAT